MGYFNYFIKCIIRNLAYKITRPKVMIKLFFICILSFITFLFLHSTGYCAEWTDGEIEAVLDGLATITSNQGTIISQLSSMGVDVSDIETELSDIKTTLSTINTNVADIDSQIYRVVGRLDLINTKLSDIYTQQGLYYEDMSKQLNEIRNALLSNEPVPVSVENLGTITITTNSNTLPGIRKYKLPMKQGYTYKITITYNNTESNAISPKYFFMSTNLSNNSFIEQTNSELLKTGTTLSANSTGSYTVITKDYNKPYFYVTYGFSISNIVVEEYIEGLIDVIDRTNQNISDSLNENNQLQEESNQLQQEQNDFLKDDNVETDGFEFATNDTNNPTEEGFNTLFTSIYNAFCNTSSAPLTLTLPYINETFTIQPNLVSNAMQKMRFRSCGNFNSVFLLLWCLSFYI